VEIIKRVGDISQASGISAWGRAPTVMAHTRQATHGAVIPENCHPFTVGKITLAHNGVISNHGELNMKHGRTCAVDSEHLAIHLHEGRNFSDIAGYGSITWLVEDALSTVQICRMRSGSMSVVGVTIGSGPNAPQVGTVWSSDRSHLKRACHAAGLTFFEYEDLKEGMVYEIRGGKLWESEARLNLATPVYIDRRVYDLTCGIKTEPSFDSIIQKSLDLNVPVTKDSGARKLAVEIANEDRPASWAQRRHDLAMELGLTPVSATMWADDDGEMIHNDDLDEMMESEISDTGSLN
jgi:hypothetical protein